MIALNESGVSPEDQIVKAMAMSLALYQNVFVYDSVWRILKDCPKWQQVPALLGTPKKRASPDTASDSTQSDEDENSDRKASILRIQSVT